jgi:DNA replication and repair protein RecF
MAHAVAPFCAPVPVNGVARLGLAAFRNHAALHIDTTAKYNILIGPNGAGKTNILEAISLLGPGRGLRGATPDLWRRDGDSAPWGISAQFTDGVHVGTHAPHAQPQAKRRAVSVNRRPLRLHAELADIAAILWLTPQMDGLFLDDASARRKFIDRLVYAAHPEHAIHLHRYDHALKQRNRLLKERADTSLIRALDPVLVSEGVAIAAARLDKTASLNAAFDATDTAFPMPHLGWNGVVEEVLLSGASAAAAEQFFADTLFSRLEDDRNAAMTRTGVHRSDVMVTHRGKNRAASECSTGEQKALLLSLVLAHAAWLGTVRPHAPVVLLLDEVAAHLDADRRVQLFSWLDRIDAQIWMTGTDAALFDGLSGRAQTLVLG